MNKSAEIRCMHFHGTEIWSPAPFCRTFTGPELANDAKNFVLSVIDRRVGRRTESNQAPVSYDVNVGEVAAAIESAVASGRLVQVSVFSGRVEVDVVEAVTTIMRDV